MKRTCESRNDLLQSPKRVKTSFHLTYDALLSIFDHLPLHDLLQTRLVSHQFHECTNHSPIWRVLFQRDFDSSSTLTSSTWFHQYLNVLTQIPKLVHISDITKENLLPTPSSPQTPSTGYEEILNEREYEYFTFSLSLLSQPPGERIHRVAVAISLLSSRAFIPKLESELRVAKVVKEEGKE